MNSKKIILGKEEKEDLVMQDELGIAKNEIIRLNAEIEQSGKNQRKLKGIIRKSKKTVKAINKKLNKKCNELNDLQEEYAALQLHSKDIAEKYEIMLKEMELILQEAKTDKVTIEELTDAFMNIPPKMAFLAFCEINAGFGVNPTWQKAAPIIMQKLRDRWEYEQRLMKDFMEKFNGTTYINQVGTFNANVQEQQNNFGLLPKDNEPPKELEK